MTVRDNLVNISNLVKGLECRIQELELEKKNKSSMLLFDNRIHGMLSLIPVKVSIYRHIQNEYALHNRVPKSSRPNKGVFIKRMAEKYSTKNTHVLDIINCKYDKRRYIGDNNES